MKKAVGEGTDGAPKSNTAPAARVWIAQALCPARHALTALAFVVDIGTPEHERAIVAAAETSLLILLDEAIEARVLNPWCGLCHAARVTWHVESGPTQYRSMDEARPHLEAAEREQQRVRRLVGEQGVN